MRLRTNCTLNPYDRSTFYKVNSPVGYIDYPFATGLHEPKIIEDAEGAKVKRSMYAETRRENMEVLDAIRDSEWNTEMNPIVLTYKDTGPKQHDFAAG